MYALQNVPLWPWLRYEASVRSRYFAVFLGNCDNRESREQVRASIVISALQKDV